jgi:RNA polymerase sigma factor (sigma-70 family)
MLSREPSDDALKAWAEAAASGDRAAAQRLLAGIQDSVYGLGLRMLGHPADAEDATQEILVIVLTHLGSFQGEARFSTWVFRIAANHLLRARRGRRETLSFELLAERLDGGLSHTDSADPEAETLALEIRLRCTEAMLLSLDRESRIAFVLGEIFQLSSDEAAAVLELDAATFRKRLSRARQLLLAFMRQRCGVFDAQNPCRCSGQVDAMLGDGRLKRDELLHARHPVRGALRVLEPSVLEQGTKEVNELMRVADVLRGHPEYAAPESLLARLRELLDGNRLELLRH